jgi:hypothetical protein
MIHNYRKRFLGVASGALALLLNTPLGAQQARDPTVEPGESASTKILSNEAEGVSVLVRGEKSFLVVGTRLYAPGDKVGGMRVERITETEVWMHDGKVLIKIPRFAGITRNVSAPKPLCTPTSTVVKPSNSTKRAKPKTTSQPPNPPAPAVACEDTPL